MGRIHDAITRNGTDFQRMLVDKEDSRTRSALPGPSGNIEPLFERAKFGPGQIDRQELAELREGLIQIEKAIADPVGWIAQDPSQERPDLTESDLRPMLAERKRRMLRRIDLLVNSSKIQKIRQLAGGISDRRTRSAIFKELNELLAKDEMIEAEYRRLETQPQAVISPRRATGEVSAPAAGTMVQSEGLATAGGFAALPAGVLLLVAAAVAISVVYSLPPSRLEIILAALLVVTGGSLLRRERNASREGRRR